MAQGRGAATHVAPRPRVQYFIGGKYAPVIFQRYPFHICPANCTRYLEIWVAKLQVIFSGYAVEKCPQYDTRPPENVPATFLGQPSILLQKTPPISYAAPGRLLPNFKVLAEILPSKMPPI
jgi:hypothetical protein